VLPRKGKGLRSGINGRFLRALAFALGVGQIISVANATHPLVTDDARIVDPKSCQVESWALPACNFTSNLELAAGAARIRPDVRSPRRPCRSR
jgi:hypothetical protein